MKKNGEWGMWNGERGTGNREWGRGMMALAATLAAAALVAVAGCRTPEEKSVEDETVKVLMIGNSFSISCLTYLPKVAADCGVKLDLCSLFIGGCPLERHVKNARKELAEDTKGEKGAYLYGRVKRNGPLRTVKNVRLTDALKAAKWDIVTIQQASPDSWRAESYEPWGSELIEVVRRFAPQARIVVQETWSYTPFDKRLKKWKITADEMYAKLSAAYRSFASRHGLEVIPMGAAVQAWRRELPVAYTDRSFGGDVTGGRNQKPEDQFKRNPDLTWSPNSDVYHLNDKGEYFQALVWASCLLKADVDAFKDRPDGVTEKEDKLMHKIAKEVRQ